ncbi:MAG: PaaI family thioesterase [Actinomycetota bacterium]
MTELPANAAESMNDSMPEYGHKLGIVMEEWTKERVVATMPVTGNTQPDGWLHGGASCSLIETLASIGAAGVAGWPERVVMGQQQTTHFLGTSRDGTIRGVATPVHLGKSTHVWNVDLTHVESGKLVASGRVTMAVRDRRQ